LKVPTAQLIDAHLEAAAALGDLHLEPRGYYGDLISDDPLTADIWHAYVLAKSAASLSRSLPEFASVCSRVARDVAAGNS
jgi:hypothetical protein